MNGTKITGRPDSNSTPSSTTSSGTDFSRSGWPTTTRSKRRARRPSWSAAPEMLADMMRLSAETPARLAACSKRAIAVRAFLSDSARWDSMNSGGMPPITVPGMIGS